MEDGPSRGGAGPREQGADLCPAHGSPGRPPSLGRRDFEGARPTAHPHPISMLSSVADPPGRARPTGPRAPQQTRVQLQTQASAPRSKSAARGGHAFALARAQPTHQRGHAYPPCWGPQPSPAGEWALRSSPAAPSSHPMLVQSRDEDFGAPGLHEAVFRPPGRPLLRVAHAAPWTLPALLGAGRDAPHCEVRGGGEGASRPRSRRGTDTPSEALGKLKPGVGC